MANLGREYSASQRGDLLNIKAARLGLAVRDGSVVCWSEGSQYHPRQWQRWRKLFATIFVILFEFATAASATMGSLVAPQASGELGLDVGWACFTFTTM